ncbi:MAG: chaperone protein DnaJ [Parcubacteria bacterium C7867-001]|nr:MAG: chaperone protein DnaJ [Parcubacteria bacterium C7867-001]
MAKNYYDILGVEKKATQDDIKKAFRKLAQKHHPDKGGDEAVFKEITEAYSVLSDDKRRREYDSYGQTFGGTGAGARGFDFSGFQGFQQGGVDFDISDLFGDLGDIFSANMAGGNRPRRGRDISMDVEISFKDSILGVKRSVLITKTTKCDICRGSGAKAGTEMETCAICNGAGRIREARDSILGSFTSVRPCVTCEGTGKIPKERCVNCKGHGVLRKEEEIKLDIPAGIDNGEMIRLPAQGEAVKGGVSGDLYVKVHVKPHPVFHKEGLNIVMDLPIKLTDALLGTTVSITTIDDKTLEVKVPPMTRTEELLRLRGKGITQQNIQGDILIRLSIALPKKLSAHAKKTFEALKSEGL